MVKIPDAANKIPMMFRAQTAGRCQLQFIGKNKKEQDVERWTSEWVEKTYSDPPEFSKEVQTRIYQINWRFVTNGGQDDGIIRPVIGAYGWPYYPGSSMKGIFCSACNAEQKTKYCSREMENSDCEPGILRFHGGYPTNIKWKENLVDIVHPQQSWQVGTGDEADKPGGAFAQISLYKPNLMFGISATKEIPENEWEEEWKEIWDIWEKAMAKGLGCRVSAGYGQSQQLPKKPLYSCQLRGQGMVAKLVNGKGEFRPNMFRAGIRGHALRIFAGLNQSRAKDIIHELFGGIEGKTKVGLLKMSFYPENDDWQDIDEDIPDQHLAYDITGTLVWTLAKTDLDSEEKELLKNLIQKLIEFAMLLGGFGKSWRRADHKKFYPDYEKHRIGCHWEWVDDKDNLVNNLEAVTKSIKSVEKAAKKWMNKKNFEIDTLSSETSTKPSVSQVSSQLSSPSPQPLSSSQAPALRPPPRRTQAMIEAANSSQNQKSEVLWRETWRSDNVQVWGRIAKNERDSWMIPWLHDNTNSSKPKNQTKNSSVSSSAAALARGTRSSGQLKPTKSIYRSDITGGLGQIGRLWHRMYPLKNGEYLELITLFHNNCSDCQTFLKWLESHKSNQNSFQKLW